MWESVRACASAGSLVPVTDRTFLAALVLLIALWGSGAQTQGVSVVPNDRAVVLMVRDTLIALDHANRTGNYGAFRDLGSPRFRNANTEARLAAIFSYLRKQGIDLRPVLVLEPRFTHKPFVDKKNLLRLTGVFSLQPRPVRFDLAYELSEGQWALFGLAVNPVNPKAKAPAKTQKKK